MPLQYFFAFESFSCLPPIISSTAIGPAAPKACWQRAHCRFFALFSFFLVHRA